MTSAARQAADFPDMTVPDGFAEASEPVRAALEGCMSRRRFAAGETIYQEGELGDAMYRIVAGRVHIRSVSPCGKEVLVVIFGVGRWIGTISLVDGMRRHNDAIAACTTFLDVLPATKFREVALSHPDLYRSLAISYATWIRDHQSMFVGGYSLQERLARRLDFLLDFSAEREEGGGLRLHCTQEVLASSIGVSRQAISKLLQEWQQRDVIRYSYGSVVVMDRPQLRRLAKSRTD